MKLTRYYRVIRASGRIVINFKWTYYGAPGNTWICELDKDQSDLFTWLFDIPETANYKYHEELSEYMDAPVFLLKESWGTVLVAVNIFDTEQYKGYYKEPPTSVDLTEVYNDKVQQAASEMGMDWEPGKTVPDDLMWYMHG